MLDGSSDDLSRLCRAWASLSSKDQFTILYLAERFAAAARVQSYVPDTSSVSNASNRDPVSQARSNLLGRTTARWFPRMTARWSQSQDAGTG